MIKRLKRWIKNEPSSQLTTLKEEGTHACLKLRENGNSLFCEVGWTLFMQNQDLHYCGTCIFGSNHFHRLPRLIKDLEQINEQTKHINQQRSEQ